MSTARVSDKVSIPVKILNESVSGTVHLYSHDDRDSMSDVSTNEDVQYDFGTEPSSESDSSSASESSPPIWALYDSPSNP